MIGAFPFVKPHQCLSYPASRKRNTSWAIKYKTTVPDSLIPWATYHWRPWIFWVGVTAYVLWLLCHLLLVSLKTRYWTLFDALVLFLCSQINMNHLKGDCLNHSSGLYLLKERRHGSPEGDLSYFSTLSKQKSNSLVLAILPYWPGKKINN